MSEHLDDAVRTAVAAAVDDSDATPGLVVTDYVVVAGTRGWDDDGEPVTQVVTIPSGPGYAMSGLLHEAQVRFDADIVDAIGGGA